MQHDIAVECQNVWKIFGYKERDALSAVRYDGLSKQEVLARFDCVVGVADVSFNVRQGEIFCIMGLSGSGKSTLVRHINRLIEPTDGVITVSGQDVNKLTPAELRDFRARKIGMVFQNVALLPHRNVRDNVAIALELRGVGKKARHAIAEEKLALVQLEDWADKWPGELSGGMKQRVGLARALAADPEILLMDEPFSALDPLIRHELQKQFLHLAAVMKKTTIFITHDLEEAIRLGTHIAIMKDGKVVQIGTAEEIVMDPKDDYVANFVAGISRLHLATAGRVMEALGEDTVSNACPRVTTDTKLNELIGLSCNTEHPIVVVSDNHPVGIITKNTLLRSLQSNR